MRVLILCLLLSGCVSAAHAKPHMWIGCPTKYVWHDPEGKPVCINRRDENEL